jgi:hypothetical protein
MSVKDKIIKELKSVFMTTLYFFSWFGALMVIKVLLLREYEIEFYGFSKVLIGALILAKVVLILEYFPLSFTKKQLVIVGLLIRTILYLGGVFLVLLLEKSFESRHEYGGFGNALMNVFSEVNIYHFWVNCIVIFGALLFFNLWSIMKKQLGPRWMDNILFSSESTLQ